MHNVKNLNELCSVHVGLPHVLTTSAPCAPQTCFHMCTLKQQPHTPHALFIRSCYFSSRTRLSATLNPPCAAWQAAYTGG